MVRAANTPPTAGLSPAKPADSTRDHKSEAELPCAVADIWRPSHARLAVDVLREIQNVVTSLPMPKARRELSRLNARTTPSGSRGASFWTRDSVATGLHVAASRTSKSPSSRTTAEALPSGAVAPTRIRGPPSWISAIFSASPPSATSTGFGIRPSNRRSPALGRSNLPPPPPDDPPIRILWRGEWTARWRHSVSDVSEGHVLVMSGFVQEARLFWSMRCERE